MLLNKRWTHYYRALLRYPLDRHNRIHLKNKNFSILSANCTAGVIYHALGLPFLSPTLNLYFDVPDFIKFVSDPAIYLAAELVPCPSEKPFPVAKLKDITLYFVHAASFEQARADWERRKNRINWQNIFIIMVERDGCRLEDIAAFDRLPYPHKVVFVHTPMPQFKSTFYIPGTEKGKEVIPLTDYKGSFTGKRYIDDFDYVEFFNSGKLQLQEKRK